MVEPPEERVLQISLDLGDQPAVVGDSAVIHFAAEGPRLAVIRVFFGDGQADSLGGASALTVSGRMTHVFQEAGAFEVIGEVEGIDGRKAEDRLMLEVVPGSEG